LDIEDVEECKQLALLWWWSSLIQDVNMRHIDLLELRISKEPRRLPSVVFNEALDLSRSWATSCLLDKRLAEGPEESVEALVELEVLWSCSLPNN